MAYVLSLLLVMLSHGSAWGASSFDGVREVLFEQPAATTPEEEAEMQVYREAKLPQYDVTIGSFVENGVDVLLNAARRTVTQKDDFYLRLKKLLHPNGVCFTGRWEMTEPSKFSGFFAKGKTGLLIGRASVALSKTTRGDMRGFGFAGKIFPTSDPLQETETANFFTVDTLLGTRADHFVESAFTNEPKLGFSINPVTLRLGRRIMTALTDADGSPGFRPVYPVSELGLALGEAARTPRWMMLRPAPGTPAVDEADFRNELNIGKHYPTGLTLDVLVSDTTKDPEAASDWQKLGHILLTESVVSYGCDRRLHFAHPPLNH